MKILLLGDFSGLHYQLASGLRELGITVKVASNGDLWKDIPRDIDLSQPKRFKYMGFLLKLIYKIPQLSNYDIVQVIAPNFLFTRPLYTYIYYHIIKLFNKNVFLVAAGSDYYYNYHSYIGKIKHSVFHNPHLKEDKYVQMSLANIKNKIFKKLNERIALDAKGIIACCPEYYIAYYHYFKSKTTFIPLPINTNEIKFVKNSDEPIKKVNIFLGKMLGRERRKGTDIIEKALLRLKEKYPSDVEITIVHSKPYNEYIELLNNADILCDQLYAYSIGLNGLIAQAKGIIACGGAESEWYELLNESENKPIVDINGSEEDIFNALEFYILNKDAIKKQSLQSRKSIEKHHAHIKVAGQYLEFWKKQMSKK
jgi:hypothetical protein